MIRSALALLALLPTLAHAADYPAAVQDSLDRRAADCAETDGGTMTVDKGAVGKVDLTGSGPSDWYIDDFHLTCSTAHSLYCGGTGGCGLTFITGDTVSDYLTKGWQVISFGPIRTVLLQVHGANCGGTNLDYCVEALVWNPGADKFFSVGLEAGD